MPPKVAVVLTVYNKPQWLRQSIESVLYQTYNNWQLIIMDDNSPNPEVAEIINSYDDQRVTKVFMETPDHMRYATARYATLINEAVSDWMDLDAKYISYLADDDYFYHDRIARMVSYLEASPNVDIVYGTQDVVDIDGKVCDKRGPFGVLDTGWNKVDHNSVMHTAKSFHLAGGWDDSPGCWGGADSHFWNRLSKAGFEFYPLGGHPTEAKRYHEDSVQWKIANECFFPKE